MLCKVNPLWLGAGLPGYPYASRHTETTWSIRPGGPRAPHKGPMSGWNVLLGSVDSPSANDEAEESEGFVPPDLSAPQRLIAGQQRRRESVGRREREWLAGAAQLLVPAPPKQPGQRQRKQLASGELPFRLPEADWVCCKRNCHVECFTEANRAMVQVVRERVFACGQDGDRRRDAIQQALRVFPCPGGLPMCVKARMVLFTCSRKFLYPMHKPGLRVRASPVAVGILAWFQLLLTTLDRMPDEQFYQVPAPDRASVFKWYEEDRKMLPSLYPKCSVQYFLRVWRTDIHTLVRLRRYSRFTKCEVCLDLKRRKAKTARGRKTDKKLMAELIKHYALIRRYRARAMKHAIRSTVDSTTYLSIAMDGTDQLGLGYPKATMHTSAQDNHRLKT